MIIGADVLLKADLKVSMKYIAAVRIEMICRSANSHLSESPGTGGVGTSFYCKSEV